MPSTRLGMAMLTIVRSSSVMNRPSDRTTRTVQGLTWREDTGEVTVGTLLSASWIDPAPPRGAGPRSAAPVCSSRIRLELGTASAGPTSGLTIGGGRPPAAGVMAGSHAGLLLLVVLVDEAQPQRQLAAVLAELLPELLAAPPQPAGAHVLDQGLDPRELGPAEDDGVLDLEDEEPGQDALEAAGGRLHLRDVAFEAHDAGLQLEPRVLGVERPEDVDRLEHLRVVLDGRREQLAQPLAELLLAALREPAGGALREGALAGRLDGLDELGALEPLDGAVERAGAEVD